MPGCRGSRGRLNGGSIIGACHRPLPETATRTTRKETGVASGVLDASRLAGSPLGLAVTTTVVSIRTRSLAHQIPAERALTGGFDLGFSLGAALTLAGLAVAAALCIGDRRAPPVDDDPRTEEQRCRLAGPG